MERDSDSQYLVAVVGAGPAGLFASKQLASQGVHVVLFNRDIKPGGLAEYGIYPDKLKMKDGLRAQFRQILAMPQVDYYGNLLVGQTGDVTLDELRSWGFQAVLVTVGAQGTKWLGLPGEDLAGVYHAKNLVYHYNHLPPFSEQGVKISSRVAVVGAGNVMLDITHWLAGVKRVDEVITMARRGPAEVKFDKHELRSVAALLDMDALEIEIARVKPVMLALGEDPEQFMSVVRTAREKADPIDSPTRFTMLFLTSPYSIIGENGHVAAVELEDNILVAQDGVIKAKGLDHCHIMGVDTVIFAIGDRVDEHFGLPVSGNEFIKNSRPRFPVEGLSYEVFDPHCNDCIKDIFVAGWSRQASTGLVGIARKDGTNGAKALLQYLQSVPPQSPLPLEAVKHHLSMIAKPLITQVDLARLSECEAQEAQARGVAEFKFDSNFEMLRVMGKNLLPAAA